MKRYLKELVLLLAVFGGLPFDVASDTAYAQTKALRINGVQFGSQDKSIYVTAYCSTIDGSTDNTTCIANAVAALGATPNGELVFPSGTYKTGTIALTNITGVKLRGVGATIVGSNGSNSVIELNNCTNCRVSGFNVQQASLVGGRNAVNNGIHVYQSTNVVIDGNTVNAVRAAGIFVQGSTNVSVTDNYVTGTLADGIGAHYGSTDVTIKGNRVIASGDDCISSVAYQGDGTVTQRIAITGNTAYNCGSRGITAIGAKYVAISGNVIDTTVRAGIQASQDQSALCYGAQHVSVTGNTINNTGAASSEASIYMIGSNATYPVIDVNVVGNTINGGALDCIKANGTVGSAVFSIGVVGNKCYGPNGAGNGVSFISVTNGQIRTNDLYKMYASGVNVDGASASITTGGNNIYFPNQGSAGSIAAASNSSTGAIIWPDFVTADGSKAALTGLATAPTPGATIQSATPATAGATQQFSPGQAFCANVWDTGAAASKTSCVMVTSSPTSGNPPIDDIVFWSNQNGAGWTNRLAARSDGLLAFGHLLQSSAGLTVDRTFSYPDRSDTIATLGATQTLTATTLSAPILSGTVTGTYTLGGTPTLSAPVLSGSITGTYTLAGTPTITSPAISSPALSGTATGNMSYNGTQTYNAATIFAASMRPHRVTVADANYTALSTDTFIAYTSISAARVITINCASNASSGNPMIYTIKDESGSASGTNTITVTPSSGTIDGSASKAVISAASGSARVYANGTNCYTW